jgi:CBS domain-containing protein
MRTAIPPQQAGPPLSDASTYSTSPASAKYRFSAVDDLQLPPALSVTTETPLDDALTMALEREYSQLTVISPERRKLLGYLDIPVILQNLKDGKYGKKEGGLNVQDVYTKFDRRKSVGYEVITPDTSLDVLEEFLKEHHFAIGISC